MHRAATAEARAIHGYLRLAPQLPVILDAILDDADAEFLESKALWESGR